MATYTYSVSGDPRAALETALDALARQQYSVKRDSEWSATVQTGSAGKVALLGAFSPHIRFTVSAATQENTHVVRLTPTTTGAAGGLLGVSKAKKAARTAGESIKEALNSTGQLGRVHVS